MEGNTHWHHKVFILFTVSHLYSGWGKTVPSCYIFLKDKVTNQTFFTLLSLMDLLKQLL